MIASAPPTDQAIIPFPRAPRTLAEAGLPFDLVEALILTTLHFAGELTGGDLSTRLGLQYSVIEPEIS